MCHFWALDEPLSFPLPSVSRALRSAAGGGGVPADAAGGGQPLVPVAGGDLQTALRQEGHRARQPHLALLRPAGHGAGAGHAGQSPGTSARGFHPLL